MNGQSFFVGIRNTFYRIAVIFGQGVLVAAAGILQVYFRNRIAFTWSLIFYALTGIFLALWFYHGLILPRPKADNRNNTNSTAVIRGMKDMIVSFFSKFPLKVFVFSILFIMFYRFPEALLGKMTTTFLQRSASEGGLGLSPMEFGIANGTIGLIAY